ncbi:hypothetical protein HHK36_032334 [Tetracentron sinense]|uniref:Cystatin domain-containing protein n=1 Tax=Tetracentron sinense TaxID=13715 RepID=A0A834Y843_TETSI|nr:hypothetical protein HHK36_032334 [Tetracentron sinense]
MAIVEVNVGNWRATLTGVWEPIIDVKNPHVLEIGEFAVTEHNKEAKTHLKFKSVVRGATQIVAAGVNYLLVVAAMDGGVTKYYEAGVYESCMGYKKLTSFNNILG